MRAAFVRRLSPVLVACFASALAACSSSDDSAPPSGEPADAGTGDAPLDVASDAAIDGDASRPSRIVVEGDVFRDEDGRQVVFRGFNARVRGLFDVTFDDGRLPLETLFDFGESDAAMVEAMGWNVMRLPLSWSGIEPAPHAYSQTYFDRVAAVLALAKAHGFFVFFDMHQDAYSKEIGEDGAPLWAIVPPPTTTYGGPLEDLGSKITAAQTLAAHKSFFDDAALPTGRTLQQAFRDAAKQLVTRFAADPTLIGIEALNEPVSFELAKLDAFHDAFADMVHDVDPSLAVLFEPTATRNQADKSRVPTSPWSHGRGVYSPHVYTGWFSMPALTGWETDVSKLAPSMLAAANEATAWGTPLFVTEFGCDQSGASGPLWLGAELDLQDRALASSTMWVWRETGTWDVLDGDGNPRAATRRVASRPFPRRVAGDLVAIERPAEAHLVVRYVATSRAAGKPHEVSASSFALAPGFDVLCDGQKVVPELATGVARFVCPGDSGEHTFELVGEPAP